MWEWIVIVGLYTLGMGLFHLLGGIRAAGEAIENWGRDMTTGRVEHASSGS